MDFLLTQFAAWFVIVGCVQVWIIVKLRKKNTADWFLEHLAAKSRASVFVFLWGWCENRLSCRMWASKIIHNSVGSYLQYILYVLRQTASLTLVISSMASVSNLAYSLLVTCNCAVLLTICYSCVVGLRFPCCSCRLSCIGNSKRLLFGRDSVSCSVWCVLHFTGVAVADRCVLKWRSYRIGFLETNKK